MEALYFTGSEIAVVDGAPEGRPGDEATFSRQVEKAGLDPETDINGISVRGPLPTVYVTLRRLENPLSSDSAYFLRSWMRQFPMAHDLRRRRDSRDQFAARLDEVTR